MISHHDLMSYIENHGNVEASRCLPSSESNSRPVSGFEVGLRNGHKEAVISKCGDQINSFNKGGAPSQSETRGQAFKDGFDGPQFDDGVNLDSGDGDLGRVGASTSTDIEAKLHVKKPTFSDLNVKKQKPTFVAPLMATKSRTKLSPRSQMLNELRFHKNKLKVENTPSRPNISAADQIHNNKTNSGLYFATKTKVDDLRLGESSVCGFGNNETTKNTMIETDDMGESIPEQKSNPEKKHVCEICQKKYAYFQGLKSHQLKGQCSLIEFVCGQCNKTFKTSKILQGHVTTVHINPRFQCGECLKIFPNQRTVDSHLKHNHMKRECQFCNKLFKNSNTLRSHIHRDHKKNSKGNHEKLPSADAVEPEGDTSQKSSGLAVKPKGSLKQIKAQGTQTCLQKCKVCGNVYNSRSGFMRHMKKHSSKLDVSESGCVGLNIEIAVDLENIPNDI